MSRGGNVTRDFTMEAKIIFIVLCVPQLSLKRTATGTGNSWLKVLLLFYFSAVLFYKSFLDYLSYTGGIQFVLTTDYWYLFILFLVPWTNHSQSGTGTMR
jgi:hypothetical protein